MLSGKAIHSQLPREPQLFFDSTLAEILLYDGENFSNITTNQVADNNPQISGENIVWSRRSPVNEEEGLFFFNGTETIRISDTSSSESPLHISGNNVVWQVFDGNDTEIFLYDGTETIQLTDNEQNDAAPQISGNNVVWSGSDGNDTEIFLYDGTETIQLTDNEQNDNSPLVSENNIVWESVSTTDNTVTNVLLAQATDLDSLTGATVYRFFNEEKGVHFYTSSEEERDSVINNIPNLAFEGASYQSVNSQAVDAEVQPVYRFLNRDTGVHLYTISEAERDFIQDSLSNYNFEGEAFYAYISEQENSIPIYRFFNPELNTHFYTPSSTERDFVANELENYVAEGIAYYGFPIENSAL